MNKWYRSVMLPGALETPVTLSKEHIDLSCHAATEGMVLLKNDGVLPLQKGTPLCLLGKGTYDYVRGGGGSGEVHTSYYRNIREGIELLCPGSVYAPAADFYRDYVAAERARGIEHGMIAEPELPEELLSSGAAFADVAIVSISRFSGEGWDRPCGFPCGEDDPWQQQTIDQRMDKGVFLTGDFSLTPAERKVVDQAMQHFNAVIVLLNVGGVVDTAWLQDDRISAAMLTWQSGTEGGLAAAKLLYGDANPCGKLPDTLPVHISDYPSTANFHESRHYVNYTDDIYVGYRYFETIPGKKERVVYPFGFGLSYTTFAVNCASVRREGLTLTFTVQVTNTGDVPGKEVVQLYVSAPQGKLGKPARSLAAFCKTGLLDPGACQEIELTVDLRSAASFDDTGAVCRSAYVLEQGDYAFFCGTDVRSAAPVFTVTLTADEVVQQLSSKVAPTALPCRLKADGTYETLTVTDDKLLVELERDAPRPVADPEAPQFQWTSEDGRILLTDVAEGRATLDDFMAQLTDAELRDLLCGQPNTGWADTCGIANLPQYGVPNIMTADGPAGVRINPPAPVRTTAFPCGTLLASTWNPELVERIGAAGGAELKENNMNMWLTPAVNIHRNPLCGRNFEYYSEDPLLAGMTGAAMVRGIQSNRVSCSVKHFACNNKETFRSESDSRVSERALREIYLKQFEIIVKTAAPMCFMTSYNAINGQRSAESRELLTDILRGEWGYRGMVTTDWWGHTYHDREILAGNDVKMPTGFRGDLIAAQEEGRLTRADLEKCARRVLEMVLKVD